MTELALVSTREAYNRRVFDTCSIEGFLDSITRARILSEMQGAPGSPADVYGLPAGPQVATRTRSARKLAVSAESRQLVRDLLAGALGRLARHFDVTLSNVEDPQFLRYEEGDYFVAHQDGNTPLIRDASLKRRVSVVIFLNSPRLAGEGGAYDGGSLVLHGRYPDFDRKLIAPATPGALFAFRSETTHEVTPVTDGERYTIVSWYRE